MIEAVIILVGGCALLFTTPSVTYEGEMDVQAYLDDFSEDNNNFGNYISLLHNYHEFVALASTITHASVSAVPFSLSQA